ncbi:MAG: T9SS type A sorting domain-containing protein [Crocinitomicaceae bacterium]|nr:T9SS type A sorting domain-containing protein [Crocinitomicaceae bacterium]
MKKAILGIAILFAQYSFAQQASDIEDVPNTKKTQITGPPAHDDAKALPFWTENFSAGIPAGWSVNDSSGICPWTYTTDGSWGFFNGDSGATAGTGINSTTAADGFLICDIDSANHYTYGQPSGTNYQYLSSYITTDAISCVGHPSVILTFEQFFRYNNGVALNVKVSNDNINWTTYDVSGGMANNTASSNADLVSLNISTIAANQATVYISIGWSARVYHWMIDDLALSEADPYDAMIGNNWWGSGQLQNQYYKIPLNQNSPITFNSEVVNNTAAQLDNVFTDVTVTNVGGVDFNGTSSQLIIAPSAMDTFTVQTTWLPSTVGFHAVDYMCDIQGQTDGNLANNEFSDSLQITNSLYGLDNLSDPSQTTGSISNFSSNTGNEFRIGNVYEIINDDGIQCVEIGIATDASNELKSIYAEVYVWDPNNQVWYPIGYSDIYEIQLVDLGAIVNLPLFGEVEVHAGEEVLVVAGHYGGATDGTDDVSFMYGQPVEEGMVYGFDGAGTSFWLSTPRAIVCRAQFDCSLAINEVENLELNVYPNPVNDILTIELTLNSNDAVIELVDMKGKVVYAHTNSLTAGQSNSVELSTTSFEEGIYTLRISSNDSIAQERIVVIH